MRKMVNFLTSICFLATWAAAVTSSTAQTAPSQPPAGAPSADCSTLIYDMIDCISFLSKGGDETTPSDSCCSGFKTVANTDADCICYAISSSVSLGLDINMTRADAMPSDCGISAFPISSCNVFTSPGASPANPPVASAPLSNTPTLPPMRQPPATTSAPEGSPAVGPSTVAGVPASQLTAPSHASSGSCAVPATFSVSVAIFAISFLFFSILGF